MAAAAVVAGPAGMAKGQSCIPGFEEAFLDNNFNDRVNAYAVFDDDGAGPHPALLYAAGPSPSRAQPR